MNAQLTAFDMTGREHRISHPTLEEYIHLTPRQVTPVGDLPSSHRLGLDADM